MTANEFIINSITEVVELFANIRVRYENHQQSNTHFIEVVPTEVYHFNKEFAKWEEQMTFEFIEKYPEQNICFISDDALIGIGEVDFEKKGELFDIVFSYNDKSYNKKVEINQRFKPLVDLEISILVAEKTPTFFSNLSNIYMSGQDTVAWEASEISTYSVNKVLIEVQEIVENTLAMAA